MEWDGRKKGKRNGGEWGWGWGGAWRKSLLLAV